MRALVIMYDGKEISPKCITKINNNICDDTGSTSICMASFTEKEVSEILLKYANSTETQKIVKADEETISAVEYLKKLCGDPINAPKRFKSNIKLQANGIFIDGNENKLFVSSIHKLARNYENKLYFEYMVNSGISTDMIIMIHQLDKLFNTVTNV